MDYQKHFHFPKGWKVVLKNFNLEFLKPSRTSRNVLFTREVLYLLVVDEKEEMVAVAECAPIIGLSEESWSEVNQQLNAFFLHDDWRWEIFHTLSSSVRFAIESLSASLKAENPFTPFCSEVSPISINGLVWMNQTQEMFDEAIVKWESGFQCIKFKVGALAFDDEWEMLKQFRRRVGNEVVIRLDANGAWTESEALEKMEILQSLNIHSIEQPIQKGHWSAMARLALVSSIPIALDEELIGCAMDEMESLLDTINPPFLVLKPSLHGGFAQCDHWISLAEKRGVGWWVTSALESNIGLNAIYRWLQKYPLSAPQGLGTGGLYTNNWLSSLEIMGDKLMENRSKKWQAPW
jgi:o-succinylbenzoate synthase